MCANPQTSVCLFNHLNHLSFFFFFFFLSPVCVTVENTYQPCDSSLKLSFTDYGVVLGTCLSFCACSISFPPESCTDCHRIQLYNSPHAKLNQSFQHSFLLRSLSLYVADLESSACTILCISFLSLSAVPLTALSAISFLIPQIFMFFRHHHFQNSLCPWFLCFVLYQLVFMHGNEFSEFFLSPLEP